MLKLWGRMNTIEHRLQRAENAVAEIATVDEPRDLSPAMQAYIQSLVALLGVMDAEQAGIVHSEICDASACLLPSRLTLNVIERALRHSRGDARPLALPAAVASIYLDPIPGMRFTRECLACGYDVQEIE